ncbi:hypothetical protein TeGR_g866 [Tetraparma gracilis]|uniref:Ankyrin n=1 Tax=Tetraparma gracilis TaxID=2962635 RepID=A0ABQ6M7R7_9STRA|nr:hypothetical protein TeGR_g866 [Tetraparma gracilis]
MSSAISAYSPPAPFQPALVSSVPALFYLAWSGNVPLLQLLRDTHDWCGMEPARLNGEGAKARGCSPLWAALANGHVAAAGLLLADPRVKVEGMYEPQLAPSPLVVASQNGHAGAVKLMVEWAAANPGLAGEKPLELTLPTPDRPTSLFKAAQNGHLEVARLLLEAGADPNSSTATDGATPLSIACYYGHLGIVELLLAHEDTDVNSVTTPCPPHMPPLHAACKACHLPALSALLADARVEAGEETAAGMNAWHFLGLSRCPGTKVGVCASRLSNTHTRARSPAFRLLLPRVDPAGALSVAPSKEKVPLTPIYLFASKGHTEVVVGLLEALPKKAAAGILDPALVAAVRADDLAMAKALLGRGASGRAKGGDMQITCLHYAALNDSPAMCTLLLDGGGDVNEKCLWKREGSTGKVGSVTARSVANQLDNKCVPILMAASKRSGGGMRMEDLNPEDVPDHFREHHETLMREQKEEATAKDERWALDVLARIKLDGEVMKVAGDERAKPIIEQIMADATKLRDFEGAFAKELEECGEPLRELVEGVKGRLKKIVEDADREQVVNDMS